MPVPENNICREQILSEDYLDIIVEYRSLQQDVTIREYLDRYCSQPVDYLTSILYLDRDEVPPYSVFYYGFQRIPSLFSLQDTTSMNASGILRLHNEPIPGLRGQGVLIGFIDTGIDYTHPVFRNPDGTTRLAGIWDQTIQTEAFEAPSGILYGTEYTPEMINAALRTADPFRMVPSRDDDGHGTFMAGIAAGGETADGSFVGAAPDAAIAMVKLKPAKQNLRDYYMVPDEVKVYQENDIMVGIRYLRNLQTRLQMPLVICLGLGSARGGHDGYSTLEELLSRSALFPGVVPVTAIGNEGNRAHHFYGRITGNGNISGPGGRTGEAQTESFAGIRSGVTARDYYRDVELNVAEGERGLRIDLWAQVPGTYSVGFVSPGGEVIPRIPARLDQSDEFAFLLEPTKLYVDYSLALSQSGSQLISIGLEEPTPGIWTIRVYNTGGLAGGFHLWLPVQGQLQPGTEFLQPDPEVTLTIPSSSEGVISAAGYNHRNGSLYTDSGRGYTRLGKITPDLAAPAVDVYGPVPGGRFTERSGTSIAAAHTAGAAAILLTWGVVNGNDRDMDSQVVRSYLIRGARRSMEKPYPNPETGYGLLDVYGVFEQLRLG